MAPYLKSWQSLINFHLAPIVYATLHHRRPHFHPPTMSTLHSSQANPSFCFHFLYLLILLCNPCTSAPLSLSTHSLQRVYTNFDSQIPSDSQTLRPETIHPPLTPVFPHHPSQSSPPHRQLHSVHDDSLVVSRNQTPSDPSDQIIKNYRPEQPDKMPKFGKLEPSIPKTIRPVLPQHINPQSTQNSPGKKASKHEDRNEKLSRMSIFSVIHPALAAALTTDRTHSIKLPAKGPLSKIEYRSSPLKGTETRDRLSLGLYPGASLSPLKPALQTPKRAISTQPTKDLDLSHSPLTSTAQPDDPSATTSQNQLDQPTFQSQSDRHPSRTLPSYSPVTSHDNAHSESGQSAASQAQHPLPHSPPPKSQLDSQLDSEPITALKRLGTSLWTTIMGNVKRTVNSITARKETQPPTPIQPEASTKQETEIGYTEEELNALIDDMMREIQSRSEDAQAHQEMLRKNNRWSANDDTGGGPLVNMRTQVLVDPEIVAQALASSARKLILSKHPRPSREATFELLRAAQVKLVEVLRPVVK